MSKAHLPDRPSFAGVRKNENYKQSPVGKNQMTVDDDEYGVDEQWETIAEELMANLAGQKELDEKENFEDALRRARRKHDDPLGIQCQLECSPAIKRTIWKKYGRPNIARTYQRGWRNMHSAAAKRATKESERKRMFMVGGQQEEYEGSQSIWNTPMSSTGWFVYSKAQGRNGYPRWVEATLVITG